MYYSCKYMYVYLKEPEYNIIKCKNTTYDICKYIYCIIFSFPMPKTLVFAYFKSVCFKFSKTIILFCKIIDSVIFQCDTHTLNMHFMERSGSLSFKSSLITESLSHNHTISQIFLI